MDNHIEVIGIDHGWSNMKTVGSVFTSGVKKITTQPAFMENIVELQGVYYQVGGKRLEVRDTKVEDNSYYVLTLASIAKELERRGMKSANILLSAGLPFTRFGAEKQDFIKYFTKNKEIRYKFEGKNYYINIVRVSVFPQCYAAIAEHIRDFPEKVVVVDIGSWTIDMMPIENYAPIESECVTMPKGLITCMRSINSQCVRQLGNEITESDIQEYMIKGSSSNLPPKYISIIVSEIQTFVEKVYLTIRENGHNLESMPLIFVGGGATVMKRFSNDKFPNHQYIQDVHANAKGFEYLGKLYLASNRDKIKLE